MSFFEQIFSLEHLKRLFVSFEELEFLKNFFTYPVENMCNSKINKLIIKLDFKITILTILKLNYAPHFEKIVFVVSNLLTSKEEHCVSSKQQMNANYFDQIILALEILRTKHQFNYSISSENKILEGGCKIKINFELPDRIVVVKCFQMFGQKYNIIPNIKFF